MTLCKTGLGRFLIVLARVGLVIHAQNMVQCAAFDLDSTIKAAIQVWKGVVEYSPRPWMPVAWFSAVRDRRLVLPQTGTGDWGTGGRKPRLTSIARRQK